MEQLGILQSTAHLKACAFTGHRDLSEGISEEKLYTELEKLIQAGVEIFYDGMAMGFDLLAAEQVLKLKQQYPQIKLIACIPCSDQDRYFPPKDKCRYATILKASNEQVCLSDHYYNGCMQKRDRYMAERADVLVAYCRKPTGGTAYTLGYFQRKYPHKPVVLI